MSQQEQSLDSIYELSDAEFTEKYGSFGKTEESLEVQHDTVVPNQSPNDLDDSVDDVYNDPIDSSDIESEYETNQTDLSYGNVDQVDIGEDEASSQTDDQEMEDSDSSVREYSQEDIKKILGTPIKAGGKEIVLDDPEDVVRLVQMGVGYHKSMEQMKPHRKTLALLEKNGLLDQDKLNYAIDLINKNPKAIEKLVKESGIDVYEFDSSEEPTDYIPTPQNISDEEVALNTVIKEIEHTPTYARTINVLGTEWDNASRELIRKYPDVIKIINDQMENGTFDTVSNEVEKYKMLGRLPQGLCDLEAYKYVGDAMYAQNDNPTAMINTNQRIGNPLANASPPIKTPQQRETVKRQKRATNPTRSQNANARPRISPDEIWSMPDEDFLKQFGSGDRY